MSECTDDYALLQAYVRDRSETAFSTVVDRHLNHVYSTAKILAPPYPRILPFFQVRSQKPK